MKEIMQFDKIFFINAANPAKMCYNKNVAFIL
jgi:hypothetical protein